jgi:hypothetical protein
MMASHWQERSTTHVTIFPPAVSLRARRWLGALALITVLAAAIGCSATPKSSSPPTSRASDPWDAAQLIRPADLARLLQAPQGVKPLLIHVGFRVLYRGGAIPGSRFAGPASRPDGVAALRLALGPVPRDRSIILYCGCCPWKECPNVRPAFGVARAMGFKDVRVLYVERDLQRDWASQGFPVETQKD